MILPPEKPEIDYERRLKTLRRLCVGYLSRSLDPLNFASELMLVELEEKREMSFTEIRFRCIALVRKRGFESIESRALKNYKETKPESEEKEKPLDLYNLLSSELLTHRQKKLLHKIFWEGKTMKEIAKQLKITEQGVSAAYCKTMRTLRKAAENNLL